MKKNLLLLVAVTAMFSIRVFAQDTIVGWTFPVNGDTSIYADKGIASNLGVRYISAEDSAGNGREITFTNGATNFAATATHWDQGAMNKFWAIKFKAVGYENLRLYSKQRAGNTNPGPKNFLLQWRFSGGSWADVPGVDTIVCANDWTGELVDVALPSQMNDTNISIYLRWVLATDENINGGTVDSNAVSKIDDILILGTPVSGSVSEAQMPDFSIYPNPASGTFVVSSVDALSSISVFNALGSQVMEMADPASIQVIDLSSMPKGIYFIRVQDKDRNTVTRKMILK